MKVVSFVMNTTVYLLGDPDFEIQKFMDVEEIREYLSAIEDFGRDDDSLSRQVANVAGCMLEGDPRIHDISSEEELLSKDILSTLSTAIAIADVEDPTCVIMSLFKCEGAGSTPWHDSGEKLISSADLPVEEDFKEELSKAVGAALPKVLYSKQPLEIHPGRMCKLSMEVH